MTETMFDFYFRLRDDTEICISASSKNAAMEILRGTVHAYLVEKCILKYYVDSGGNEYEPELFPEAR